MIQFFVGIVIGVLITMLFIGVWAVCEEEERNNGKR